jgi:transposase
MTGKGIIEMSIRELRRLKAVQEAIDKHITQRAASSVIGISERQVRRLVRAVKEQGETGIIHKARGQISPKKIPERKREGILKLYRDKYLDFGPTFAAEKLYEMDGIRLSKETLRKWLVEAGLWSKKSKKTSHRNWRPRKERFGEMAQLDGSHHDWLEGRGPELVFMAYIDDATNEVFGRFYDHEGTRPAMASFKGYARRHGLPLSVYLDRHSTYKNNKKFTPWEDIEGKESMTQFERALGELGVNVIHAYSPQAKGRVERLFGTLQDRLVKEMRLRNIKTSAEANNYLPKYLLAHNRKFSVCPANTTNAHIKLPKDFNLDSILCIKNDRTVKNDNTIGYKGKLYQLLEHVGTKRITVRENLDGTMQLLGNGGSLKYQEITERPKKIEPHVDRPKYKHPPQPASHPWRKYYDKAKLIPKKRIYANL